MELLGWLELIGTVVILSASGVLSPGPLFAATISRSVGSRTASGLESAIGHTIIEFPLVLGLAFGSLVWLQNNPVALRIIAIVGGIVLIFFAISKAWEAKTGLTMKEVNDASSTSGQSRSGVIIGVLFTALNPFFILWWLSIGWSLIVQAALLGAFGGVLVMYLAHVWMDYAWLGGVGLVASNRRLSFGKWYRGVLLVFALAMAYFGFSFIVSSIT